MLPRVRIAKTPTVARRIIARISATLGFAVLLGLQGVAAAEPAAGGRHLSEADVIAMARTQSPASAVADATDALADARRRTAGRFANPRVDWSRETIESGPVGLQDIVTATLPIDIARPLTARSLAASQSAWMRTEASLTRTDAVLDALIAYYDLVLAHRAVQVLEHSVANLEEAARVLARREAAGTASGYESTRLSIARELRASQLAQARGDRETAEARLAGLLGVEPGPLRVATSLPLLSERDEAALTKTLGASREALTQARAAERLADKARDRAAWTWLPTVELGTGMKHVSDLGGGYGYVVGVALDIPIFDRGQALRAEAEASRALSAARTEALQRTISTEVRAAHATFRAARQELERFEAKTTGQVETLLTAAQSGYREGEHSVVELLDAQQTQVDVAKRRLDLLGAAKRAEARLRAAAGDLR